MRIFALAMLTLLFTEALHAQATDSLIVHLRDGSKVTISLKDIQKLTFDSTKSRVNVAPSSSAFIVALLAPAAKGELPALRVMLPHVSRVRFEVHSVLGNIVASATRDIPGGTSLITLAELLPRGQNLANGWYAVHAISQAGRRVLYL